MIKPPCRRPVLLALFILPALAAFGAVVMLLWNWLVPAVFGGPVVTYWQAIGLLLLAKILFGSGHGKHHPPKPPESWKQHLHDQIKYGHHHPGEPAEPAAAE